MMTVRYRYPGDPLLHAVLLFGLEFKTMQPDRKVRITSAAGVEEFPVTLALCDSCNEEVKDTDPCVLASEWLWCWPCAQRVILPHVVSATSTKEVM